MHYSPRIAVRSLVVAVLCSACYHATVLTGLPASSEVVSKAWAHGFVYGLVPPSDVETASKCKTGVAKVETQHSFLNMLAQFLTFGIYTPMQIDVTCASSSKISLAPGENGGVIHAKDRTDGSIRRAIAEAVSLSNERNEPMLIVF